jgi:hypothetical protein
MVARITTLLFMVDDLNAFSQQEILFLSDPDAPAHPFASYQTDHISGDGDKPSSGGLTLLSYPIFFTCLYITS